MKKREEIRASIDHVSGHLAHARGCLSVMLSEKDEAIVELRIAVTNLRTRWGALWTLLLLPDDFKEPLLYELVDLCSVGHSDLDLCRQVLLSIDRRWLKEHLEEPIAKILAAREGCEDEDQEYRRFAELLVQVSDRLLAAHVKRCRAHFKPEIQEIADDYESYLSD